MPPFLRCGVSPVARAVSLLSERDGLADPFRPVLQQGQSACGLLAPGFIRRWPGLGIFPCPHRWGLSRFHLGEVAREGIAPSLRIKVPMLAIELLAKPTTTSPSGSSRPFGPGIELTVCGSRVRGVPRAARRFLSGHLHRSTEATTLVPAAPRLDDQRTMPWLAAAVPPALSAPTVGQDLSLPGPQTCCPTSPHLTDEAPSRGHRRLLGRTLAGGAM